MYIDICEFINAHWPRARARTNNDRVPCVVCDCRMILNEIGVCVRCVVELRVFHRVCLPSWCPDNFFLTMKIQLNSDDFAGAVAVVCLLTQTNKRITSCTSVSRIALHCTALQCNIVNKSC